jgi:F-type H+-transporting ATPase subunit delta
MANPLVAERYAKALFDLAIEKNQVEEVYQDNNLIASTCEESRELKLLLKSPIINSVKKGHILKEIFSRKVSNLTLTYLLIMVRKKRESFIPEIAQELVDLYLTYKNILKVHFSSPAVPDEEIRAQVVKIMEHYTKSKILLSSEIDEELIGGFVITFQDKQYDASIRRDIENMRAAIAKVNLYKKGF